MNELNAMTFSEISHFAIKIACYFIVIIFLVDVGVGRTFYDVKPCTTFYIEILNPPLVTESSKRSLEN